MLLACFLLLFTIDSEAEIVIIAHKDNQLSLGTKQIEDIFLGRIRFLPNGNVAFPIDHAGLRTEFYQKLTTRPIEQINAYWARITFTGQASPPIVLPDDKAVLLAINKNKDAIGYINKQYVNNSVRILYTLN